MTQADRNDPDLQPLFGFYTDETSSPPLIERVEREEIPEPYRSLLAHELDMTSTLNNIHGDKLHLTVLKRRHEGMTLAREVVLLRDRDDRPVEYGAIVVHLENLSEADREGVLEGYVPLGAILLRESIPHRSKPSSYIRVRPDVMLLEILDLRESGPLYGRCNKLTHASGEPLAEVVEILPPLGEQTY